MSFCNNWQKPAWFLVLKGVTPTFSNLGIVLKIHMRNCSLLGKLLSVWSFFLAVSALPKSAQPALTVENSHSYFNVSNTWYKSLGKGWIVDRKCNMLAFVLSIVYWLVQSLQYVRSKMFLPIYDVVTDCTEAGEHFK